MSLSEAQQEALGHQVLDDLKRRRRILERAKGRYPWPLLVLTMIIAASLRIWAPPEAFSTAIFFWLVSVLVWLSSRLDAVVELIELNHEEARRLERELPAQGGTGSGNGIGIG